MSTRELAWLNASLQYVSAFLILIMFLVLIFLQVPLDLRLWVEAVLSLRPYHLILEQTSSQLAWFMQAMILFPKAQAQAQAELDEVVGPNRLPTFKDYECLPYVRALVEEVLRWRSAAPLGAYSSNTSGIVI